MKQKCAKDLRAFAPAAIPSHPDTLSTGRSTRKTSQDFGLDGRAGRNGLSSRYSETRFPPLDPPWLENISTVAMQPKFADAKEFSSRLRELRRPLYRSVALGKHTTGRLKQNSPLPFLLANAHVASCGWLGIHEADLQAVGLGTALTACHASKWLSNKLTYGCLIG